MIETVVFAGPTIAAGEFRRLENCLVMPPATCGDVLKVLRLQPKCIAIIDGCFETTSSVWHKEILYALSQGIEVFGASSIGALRAAELYTFGMVGVGEIYRMYRSGELNDDAEVALIHTGDESGYVNLTIPMINVRFTFTDMLEKQIISKKAHDDCLSSIQKVFYQERSLDKVVGIIRQKLRGAEQEGALDYIEKCGIRDQKKSDAQLLIKIMAERKGVPQKKGRRTGFTFKNTLFFNKLYFDTATEPFDNVDERFPREERINAAFASTPMYALLQPLARSMMVISSHFEYEGGSSLEGEEGFSEWFGRYLKSAMVPNDKLPQFVKYTRILFAGLNEQYTIREDYQTVQKQLITLAAKCWLAIYGICEQYRIEPSKERVRKFSDNFRNSLGLFGIEEMKRWLQHVGLTEAEWFDMIKEYDRFTFITDNYSKYNHRAKHQIFNGPNWLYASIMVLRPKEVIQAITNEHVDIA